MTRRTVLVCCAAALSASVLFADQGTVKTKDGATYRGEVSERGQNVIIKIHGVETVIPKTEIESIESTGDIAQELREKLKALPADDVAGRIALARRAFDKRQYELAQEILDDALRIDPNDATASQLREVVQSQIRLERNKQEAGAAAAAPPKPAVTGQGAIERHLLTQTDIDEIRRRELGSRDTGIPVNFLGDVKKRYAQSQNMSYADFNARPAVEQALAIIKSNDNSMSPKVRVMRDPWTMLEYRRHIQPLVLNNCATGGCHGGPEGAGLVLFTTPETDAIAYTNFYILHKYAKKVDEGAGVFGGAERKLIDRGNGDQSLLASYGLPASIGEYDHPLVNGKPITPAFRNKDDERYKMLVGWMNTSLTPVEPDYGIHYTPPTATEIAPPATAPAP